MFLVVGLFEREVHIQTPNVHERLGILSKLTKDLNLHTDVCLKKVAEETRGHVASDLASLCNIAGMQVIRRKIGGMQIRKEEGFLVDKTCLSGDSFPSSISNTLRMEDFMVSLLIRNLVFLLWDGIHIVEKHASTILMRWPSRVDT